MLTKTAVIPTASERSPVAVGTTAALRKSTVTDTIAGNLAGTLLDGDEWAGGASQPRLVPERMKNSRRGPAQ